MANSDAIEIIDLSGNSPPSSPKTVPVARKTNSKITDSFTVHKGSEAPKHKRDSEFDDDGYVSDTARSTKSQHTQQDSAVNASASVKTTVSANQNNIRQITHSISRNFQQTHTAGPTTPLPTSSANPQQSSQFRATPSTSPPPEQTSSPLKDIPQIHPRYAQEYVDTASKVVLKDPKRFCVKPPYWHRWKTSQYHDLIEDLRRQWDPTPFAAKHNVTVEEVRAVFTATVCDPLYNAPEEARKSIEGRMEDKFDMFNKHGTQPRIWTNDQGRKIKAEFTGVEKGMVQLLREDGTLVKGLFKRLSAGNQEYVREMIGGDDLRILLGEESASSS